MFGEDPEIASLSFGATRRSAVEPKLDAYSLDYIRTRTLYPPKKLRNQRHRNMKQLSCYWFNLNVLTSPDH